MSKDEIKKYKAKIKADRKKLKNKQKVDGRKIFTAVLAGILCLLMLLSVCGTLIAVLFAG